MSTPQERNQRIDPVADKARELGFPMFAIICWDENGHWTGRIEPKPDVGRMRFMAQFFTEAADIGERNGRQGEER